MTFLKFSKISETAWAYMTLEKRAAGEKFELLLLKIMIS